ncbi:hypothetical protein [Embleya sp. AB8]|uniref:hypothetical protein n=1 Tax=Embleya sp. AB8 TaxID=3156304 RepID=UPI003C707ACE
MHPARGRLTAVVVVALLLAAGACRSDSDEALAPRRSPNGPSVAASSPAVPSSGASDAAKGGEFTVERLRAAWVVQGDLPTGWTPTGEATRPALNPKATRPQCQPIADLEDLSGSAAPAAVTHLGLDSQDSPGTFNAVSIAVLPGNDAAKALEAAGKALPSCGDYAVATDDPAEEGSAAAYTLTGGAGHDLGDDSLTMDFGTGGQYSFVVTVVRVGPILLRGTSMGTYGPPPTAIPKAVMKAQVDRIARLTRPAR